MLSAIRSRLQVLPEGFAALPGRSRSRFLLVQLAKTATWVCVMLTLFYHQNYRKCPCLVSLVRKRSRNRGFGGVGQRWISLSTRKDTQGYWVIEHFQNPRQAWECKCAHSVRCIFTFGKLLLATIQGPQQVLKCAVEKVEAKFRNVTEILCEHMLGLASGKFILLAPPA